MGSTQLRHDYLSFFAFHHTPAIMILNRRTLTLNFVTICQHKLSIVFVSVLCFLNYLDKVLELARIAEVAIVVYMDDWILRLFFVVVHDLCVFIELIVRTTRPNTE